jgi:histidinol phosphatase-like enzyme
MDKIKKTILVDLDGVLNTYNGEYDENSIPQMKDGAKEFLQNLSKNIK